MKNFKNFIKEAHLGNPLNENKYLSNKDSYIKISEPSFRKDKNNPNFLSAYIKYDTGPGVGIALGKETMAGQIRRLSSAEALRQMEIIGRKLNDSYDLEDLDINDLENGVVELFAVSDDFIGMDPRSELSMAMLGENQKYDDEDIVIYDGEEHIIMRKDGNMAYIRPLEDSAILGKKDVIKVPARALAYKSDLDKMYDEYKPKDEVNEEFSSTEQKMIKQIQSYKKRDSAMVNLPSKVRDFYFKNKEKIDALNENMGEWPKELTSRYSDEYRFELEKVMSDRAKYRVIDIESGELKSTPVFGKPESLMAFADDLIKPQGGTQSTNLGESLEEDMNDPVLMKARAAKIADEKEMARQAALDKKYGSSFMGKLDAEIDLKQEFQDLKDEREQLMIDMEQEAEPEGGEIADRYGSRLNNIDAKMAVIKSELEDLRMYESVNEAEIPLWLTDNREFEKAVIVSTSYNDFEKRAYGILGPKYFKLLLSQSPGVLKDYYDSIRVTRPSMEEAFDLDIDDAHSGDAALNRTVGRMEYNESLKKSLKESLNKRLGK